MVGWDIESLIFKPNFSSSKFNTSKFSKKKYWFISSYGLGIKIDLILQWAFKKK